MKTLDLLESDRYELVYNGVDLTRVEPNPARGIEFRRRFGIPDSRNVIAQISWIIPEKGIPDLLDVAKVVLERDQNAHFVIVGEGPYREQYMKDAREMGLSDNVTWTGLIMDPFGEGVFDAADIVCQFSRWEELFGWMIAEAMAYKKPIVATNVGGIPELVADGESGYLVERDNPTAAAERLFNLLRDSDLRHKMGAEGCRRVHTKFNLRQNVEQLISSYKLQESR
jgi:glycosyltransferase involved in cell wall biosynthesis